jgi:restriction system protein
VRAQPWPGVGVARQQEVWAEAQRERARQARDREQERRESQRAQARAARAADWAERDRKLLAADERVRKIFYIEDRMAEAAAMARDVRARLAELDGVLKAGLRDRPVLTFASLRRTDRFPAFDAGRLGAPLTAPQWEHFVPEEPAERGRFFGGTARARFEQQLDSARAAYAEARERYEAAEDGRRRQFAEQRAAYDAAAAAFAAAVAEHNAGVDQFARDCWAADPEAIAEFCTLVLDLSIYPDGFPHQARAVYRPGQQEVVIERELPPQSVIPPDRDYQYVLARDAIDPVPRPQREVNDLYQVVIAQVALRTIHEILISTPGGVIELVTFYGKVSSVDPASGQPVQRLLLQVSAERKAFDAYPLAELDPVACLGRLNALSSPHPYDLVPVQPTADFDSLPYSQRPAESAEAAESPESAGAARNGLSSPAPETAR